MLLPRIFDDRACSVSRVPAQSGQVWKVTARSTNARMCGCIDSASLDSIDFVIFGIRPSYVRLMPSTLIFVGSLYRSASSSFLVNVRIGLSGSKKPQPLKMRPNQPSIV
ncbi:MAG: hypothetical protein JWN77_1723 [Frankiales bacterium]|jgi:hypothetical protein|nr:hypothetical protein [Frankiales bacterium]